MMSVLPVPDPLNCGMVFNEVLRKVESVNSRVAHVRITIHQESYKEYQYIK